MNKGKIKESAKKYLSIVFIPHSSNQVKVFKVTSFYGKLFSILLLVATISICTAVILSQTSSENRKLKENLSELYSANAEQRKLLNDKAGEIEKLKENDEAYRKKVDELADEYTKQYNDITDKYITNQSTSKTSRSGDRSVQGFSDAIGNMKSTLDKLNKLTDKNNTLIMDISESNSRLEKYFDTIPTIWPVSGRISDTFGYRKDPFTRRRADHEGLDLAADRGTGVKASASGKVIFAGRNGGYGLSLIIDHGKGLNTRYGHCSKLLVEEGQVVKKGDIIAKVGSTGRSTGPHLHFEILLYGTPVDPLLYLDKR